MIDPHVHLRDWDESRKETIEHGLRIAYLAGLDAVFEMPNTNPPLITKEAVIRRFGLADKALEKMREMGRDIFHGIYGGITANPKLLEEIVSAYDELFPRLVGLKMFATHSTGNMGIIGESSQRLVYKTLAGLGYKGVLVVHCENEAELRPGKWNPREPYTHTLARPPEAELESVRDQIRLADEAGFEGTLHICHISVPAALEHIEWEKKKGLGFEISCGITPQHCRLYDKMMKTETDLLLKLNPPLRPREMQEYMLNALLDGRIDWIESDHAPHTLADKTEPPYASGIPVLPYLPHFIKYLSENGASQEEIDNLTHTNIARTFGIDIKNTHREPVYNLAGEYPFNPFGELKIETRQD